MHTGADEPSILELMRIVMWQGAEIYLQGAAEIVN